jgi:arsenate reductase
MKVTIYHNPKCSKSRQTLQLLQGKGIEPEIIEYLKTPPSKTRLRDILKMLQLEPRDLMRKKETLYKEAGFDDEQLTKDQLIEKMVAHPGIIERPIVVASGKAAIGRPPERVLDIL